MKIKHVNENLAVRASLSKVTKNKGTILNVMTLVRMPVMKVGFNVCCCYKHTSFLVTQANALSLRKAQEETKKVIEGCLPTTKGRKNPARNQ